jgi:hypothetical protein
MGNELFGVDIAGIIADSLGDGLLRVTIERPSRAATRQAGDLTGGFAAGPPQNWECAGFFEDFTGTPPPTVELKLGDRKAVLIGDTIPADLTVEPGDKITVHEDAGPISLFAVKLIGRDPAAAVYTYLCRDRGSEAA